MELVKTIKQIRTAVEKLDNFKRNTTITKFFNNKNLKVYNGYTFNSLTVSKGFFYFKLGSFVPTRKSFRFKKCEIQNFLSQILSQESNLAEQEEKKEEHTKTGMEAKHHHSPFIKHLTLGAWQQAQPELWTS